MKYEKLLKQSDVQTEVNESENPVSSSAVKEAIDNIPSIDVQIAGTSIVQDGVANIPIANLGTAGVVKVREDLGTRMIGDAVATIYANEAALIARDNGYKVIVPATYDLAVKHAMCDAVGTKNPAWTDEEKVVAKTRLGIKEPADVQIAGTSIIKNGIANIPYASNDSVGLVKTSPYRGMSMLSSGLITILAPTEAQIRSTNTDITTHFAITPSTLDYAVKVAMCDGKGAAWTADEQSAARARMGAVNKYLHTINVLVDTNVGKYNYCFSFMNTVSTPYTKLFQVADYLFENHPNINVPASGTYYDKTSTDTAGVYMVQRIVPSRAGYVNVWMYRLSDARERSIETGQVDITDFVQ